MLVAFLVSGFASAVCAADTPVELRDVRDRIVYSPSGEYMLAWEKDATCTVVMVVDPVSGRVTGTYIEESSGDDYINRVASEMLRRWKFKPGSPRLIRTSFAFGSSAWRNAGRDDSSERLQKVLRPFLGKNALVKGSLPEYPRDKAWTNRRGTGVFLLSVDAAGRVTDVTVKKSSGDAPFDGVTVRAMQQWKFRKGPIKIELPLYFALTPHQFVVRGPEVSVSGSTGGVFAGDRGSRGNNSGFGSSILDN
jgi:TonB family protein